MQSINTILVYFTTMAVKIVELDLGNNASCTIILLMKLL